MFVTDALLQGETIIRQASTSVVHTRVRPSLAVSCGVIEYYCIEISFFVSFSQTPFQEVPFFMSERLLRFTRNDNVQCVNTFISIYGKCFALTPCGNIVIIVIFQKTKVLRLWLFRYMAKRQSALRLTKQFPSFPPTNQTVFKVKYTNTRLMFFTIMVIVSRLNSQRRRLSWNF